MKPRFAIRAGPASYMATAWAAGWSSAMRYNAVPLGMDILCNGESSLAGAAEFPVPLLLMHSVTDRITSLAASQEFARSVDGRCTFKLWDGLYHEIHNEPEKQEVLEYMIRWMDGHRKVET